jgi:3-hydroxymyristoyl/3-hydroxydecanoyl-(acyl carrier protein) dehydratase
VAEQPHPELGELNELGERGERGERGELDELGFEGEPFAPPLTTIPAGPVLVPLPAPAGNVTAPAGNVTAPAGNVTAPAGNVTAAALARDLAEQGRRAHAAVLAAHGAVQDWLLTRRQPARSLPAVHPPSCESDHPDHPDQVHHVELEYPIPADDGSGCPAAFVLDAAASTVRRLVQRGPLPAGAVHHPGRATLHWAGCLPEGPGTLRVRAELRRIERDEQGVRYAYAWQAHSGDRSLAQATGSAAVLPPGPARAPDSDWPQREVPRYPRQFRPLAATPRDRLTGQDVLGLAGGYTSSVFGPPFTHQASTLRLSRQAARLLLAVDAIEPAGGRLSQGRLAASVSLRQNGSGPDTDPAALLVEAAVGVLQAYALQRGLHLCMPDSRFQPWDGCPAQVEVLDAAGLEDTLRYEVEVAELALVPRPHVVGDVQVLSGDRPVARLHGIGVAVRERPGEQVAAIAAFSGDVPACRHNAAGEPAPMNELHVAYSSEGDLSVLLPGGALDGVRPRLPRGDFLLVDRALTTDAEPGEYRRGTALVSEYDVHPDPWFCRENGSDAVPNVIYMESALQSVTAISATQGIVQEYPGSPFVCRNLDGRATLLRDADPRGRTLRQRTTLVDHSPLPGAILHRYAFEVAVDGEPLYAGETVHGFFTPEVLARQQGLDGGQCVQPWLERQSPHPPGVRRLDLHGDTRLGRGRLALLGEIDLLDDGGEHGAGYALWERPVPRDDWFMAHHFFGDPVMPGSVGVEALFQAVGAWALHTPAAEAPPDPVLRPAAGVELAWKYRGQILREHRRMRGEVHIREVRTGSGRITIIADGSVWRDDLRIYQVDNIGVEIASGQERP